MKADFIKHSKFKVNNKTQWITLKLRLTPQNKISQGEQLTCFGIATNYSIAE